MRFASDIVPQRFDHARIDHRVRRAGHQTVKDLVAGSDLRFAEKGEHRFKGIPDPWHLYGAHA